MGSNFELEAKFVEAGHGLRVEMVRRLVKQQHVVGPPPTIRTQDPIEIEKLSS